MGPRRPPAPWEEPPPTPESAPAAVGPTPMPPAAPLPPAPAAPPVQERGVVDIEDPGQPTLGVDPAGDVLAAPGAPLAAPAMGWTPEQASTFLCGAVDGIGVVLYGFLAGGRLDLYAEHWVVGDPAKATRGWDDALARSLDRAGVPASGAGPVGAGVDGFRVAGGLAGMLVPRVAALQRDRKRVAADKAPQLQPTERPPTGPDAPAPAAAPPTDWTPEPAAPVDSTRFQFSREDASHIARAGEQSANTAGLEGFGY
jgi:hypothetical protein